MHAKDAAGVCKLCFWFVQQQQKLLNFAERVFERKVKFLRAMFSVDDLKIQKLNQDVEAKINCESDKNIFPETWKMALYWFPACCSLTKGGWEPLVTWKNSVLRTSSHLVGMREHLSWRLAFAASLKLKKDDFFSSQILACLNPMRGRSRDLIKSRTHSLERCCR